MCLVCENRFEANQPFSTMTTVNISRLISDYHFPSNQITIFPFPFSLVWVHRHYNLISSILSSFRSHHKNFG